MARTIGALCTFIVCLQILIGIPLAVCVACFCVTNGPITIEVHAGQSHAPQFIVHGATVPPPGTSFSAAPPPNAIPHSLTSTAAPTSFDNPILQSRAAHGSPLAGTMLESADPTEERDTFVAALEKAALEQAATEHTSQQPQPVCSSDVACPELAGGHPADCRAEASALIVQHLYVMADIDEHAGNYDRADQWRAEARQIKDEQRPAVASDASPAALLLPTSDDLPRTGQ